MKSARRPVDARFNAYQRVTKNQSNGLSISKNIARNMAH